MRNAAKIIGNRKISFDMQFLRMSIADNREYVLHYTLGRSNRPSDVKNHEQRLALEVALNLKWLHVGGQNTCACPTTDMT